MAEIHSENVEINEIINYMSNIPHIDGAESTDDEEESDVNITFTIYNFICLGKSRTEESSCQRARKT